MSLRHFSSRSIGGSKRALRAAAFSALLAGMGASGAVYASTDLDPRLVPPVQNYAEQAVPVPAPQQQQYYDSPLAAGTLTLQDVLEAHKPNPETANLPAIGATPSSTATAPILTPPPQASSTSLMMSQGMRAVLQKVGETSVTSPTQMRPPSLTGQPLPDAQATAQGQPASLLPAGTSAVAPIPAPATVGLAPGVKYEPGQEPRNLATAVGGTAAPASDTSSAAATVPISGAVAETPSAASSVSPTQSCDKDVQKWEKSCGDAGYPATYMGKIIGETHTGCADGALHDVWVSNTCAPPDAASAQSPATDGACGPASNNQFDNAPTANLCAQGIASAVTGSGPWSWACSGINGGNAAACTAGTQVTPVNAACGSANGVPVYAAPVSDLCDTGTATAVRGSGPWTWSCRGIGTGSTQSCIAPAASGAAHAAAARAPVEEESAVSSAPVGSVSAAPAAAPSEKGELCGTAAETLAYEAPDKDLCRAGTPSVVNGDGPWSWSCTDNEGLTSTCRTLSLNGDSSAAAPAPAASEAPAPSAASSMLAAHPEPTATSPRAGGEEGFVPSVPSPTSGELACGEAAIEPASQAPTDSLCVNGNASAVHGKGPWHWTCSKSSNGGHHKVSCETPKSLDGKCGPANGTSLKSAPFAGLCSAGTPTGIEGDGPWNWTCSGSGAGVSVSCAASLQQSKQSNIDGTCGASANQALPSAPADNLCATGSPSAVSGQGPWTWSCSGLGGGSVSSCSASKLAPTPAPGPVVNGLCGAANGVTATSQPVDGLCASGAAASIVGNGPWNWSCLGENGGMTVSCTAPLEPPAPIDGVCGGASGVPTLVRPQSGLCDSGITGAVSGRGPWTWTCSGANGGSPASCVAPVAGKTGSSMPSLTSTPSGGDMAAPAAAPSGLVTPRLPTSSNSSLPALDRKVIPSLTPSNVPQAASVNGAQVPGSTPDIEAGMEPVQPPAIGSTLPSAAALQESAEERAARIPGNHLVLDPTISTVLFTRGSGNIDEQVLSTLDKLSSVLLSNPDVRITLTAYADNDGSTPRDARRLSLTRALAVRDYLASKGVADSRVDVKAEGANTTSGYIDRVDVKVND